MHHFIRLRRHVRVSIRQMLTLAVLSTSVCPAWAVENPDTPSGRRAVGAEAQLDGDPISRDDSATDELPANVAAQPSGLGADAPQPPASSGNAGQLQFSFDGAAWREVIRWIADEAELALQYVDLPTGSFTYSDLNRYSPQQAIARINLFLLPQGYTLVRSGQLLSVINLGDPRSIQQLDSLAELVTDDQLVDREDHEVVKCLFALGPLEAGEAVDELSALNLMRTPAVFSRTNQLMITDTVKKLRSVSKILDAYQGDETMDGRVVESFSLQHVDAEDVMVVARPHLGLATGEMIGIDVSMSADPTGKNLFVTGVEDKVKLIEGLINSIDKPEMNSSTTVANAELRSHRVTGGNLETVYNVLQTLLAGKPVRLSTDEAADSIVALATPDIHQEIEATVTQLAASDADFEVIPLRSADPYLVISLLEQMLDLPDAYADPDEIDPDAPKLDADPAGRRLFVRAKKHQIEQIKKIVAGLDGPESRDDSDDTLRVFPLLGHESETILQTAARFWRGDNPVILYRSTVDSEKNISERVVSGDSRDSETLTSNREPIDELGDQRWMIANPQGDAPAIRCQLTARGLLMQSDDPDALDRFEDHLREIIGPGEDTASPPIVFYLKYTKPDDALRMLAELIDGGEMVSEGTSPTLVNGYVSSGSDTYFGSLVTSNASTTTLLAGSITVIADSRLNRLIAQGTAGDIQRIEEYLNIIDKDTSITTIETHGSSRVIELYHTKASEVAEALRDAFAGRVNKSSASVAAGNANGADARASVQREREDDNNRDQERKNDEPRKPNAKGSAAGSSENLEPKMTIAVHEPSNSLIVTAPEQLFLEVERLARSIDARGEQTVEVVVPLRGELIETVLRELMLGESSAESRSSSASDSSSKNRGAR